MVWLRVEWYFLIVPLGRVEGDMRSSSALLGERSGFCLISQPIKKGSWELCGCAGVARVIRVMMYAMVGYVDDEE